MPKFSSKFHRCIFKLIYLVCFIKHDYTVSYPPLIFQECVGPVLNIQAIWFLSFILEFSWTKDDLYYIVVLSELFPLWICSTLKYSE